MPSHCYGTTEELVDNRKQLYHWSQKVSDANAKRKSQDVRFLPHCTLEVQKFRMNTALVADGTKAVTSILTLLCRITSILFVSAFRSRLLPRFGRRFLRIFFLAKFLHDICEVFENASFPIRKCFNTQVPIVSSKQWLHEMWLSRTDVQESPSWHQYAHYFSKISVNVFPDVVRRIPHGAMEPIGLMKVSINQSMSGLEPLAK